MHRSLEKKPFVPKFPVEKLRGIKSPKKLAKKIKGVELPESLDHNESL